MALITLLVFSVLLGGVELGLRLLGIAPEVAMRAGALDPAEVVLLDPPPFTQDALGCLVANLGMPGVNDAGYRTPSFDEPANGRKTVLFIGDSFTWGQTARPLTNAFVDRVRAAGYRTINLGIPATGTTQYLAEAREYVPKLHPDAVCVMFYLGNDFTEEFPVQPGPEHFHVTSIGMLSALDDAGRPITFEEAKAKVLAVEGPGPAPAFRRLLRRTATGTAISLCTRVAPSSAVRKTAALENLRQIRDLCAVAHTRLLFFLIPTRSEITTPKTAVPNALEELKELAPIPPPTFDSSCFAPWPEHHFNNAGHQKMADFIVQQLSGAGFPARRLAASPTVPDEGPVPLGEEPTLEMFSAALRLAPEQRLQVEKRLDELKAAVADTFFQSTSTGDASPGVYLALLQAKEGGAAESSFEAFDKYNHANRPEGGSKTYAETVGDLVGGCYQDINDMLTPLQQYVYKSIPLELLLNVKTGQDPFGAKIHEATARLKARAQP